MRYNNVEFAQNQTIKQRKDDSLLRNTTSKCRFSKITINVINYKTVRIPKTNHIL